jgi:hypothetical protein
VSYGIRKQTYSGQRAYRYHISDESGKVCYVAEPTGLLLPNPTRLIEFFDCDHRPVGCLKPLDVSLWRGEKRYGLFVDEGGEEPYAVIQERARLVDVLLLRLPRYEVQLGEYRYVARGSRYGLCCYEIFFPQGEGTDDVGEGSADAGQGAEPGGQRAPRPDEMKVGRISCPKAGPSYVVEIDAAPLCQALIVLAALVILIDLELSA